MRPERFHWVSSGLQSRVARRVVSLFVACALLPVAAFAVFAYQSVLSELEQDAFARLHRESKNAGMSILERLMLLDNGMLMVLTDLRAPSPERIAAADTTLREITHDGARHLRLVERAQEARLTPAQREQLRAGGSVLLAEPRGDGPARLTLMRSPRFGARSPILAADLTATYVFAADGRDLSDHYWVEDGSGARLFATERAAHSRATSLPADPREHRRYWTADDERLLGASWPLFLASRFGGGEWVVAHARPTAEIYRPADNFKATFPLVVGVSLLAVTLLSLAQIRRRLVPIEKLVEGTRRIAAGRFAPVEIETQDEFQELAGAFNQMSREIQQRLDMLATVNAIGVSLSGEVDIDRLLNIVLRGSISVTKAHGGSLFLRSEDGRFDHTVLMVDGKSRGSDFDAALGVACVERCAAEGTLRQRRGAAGAEALDPREWQGLQDRYGFSIGSLLGVPMRNERGRISGVLLLYRALDADGRAHGFDEEACELASSLASQAAVALAKTRLVESFRALFEGLIQLTVRAIDEKSAHTGNHCRKVPILTEMIADAACAETSGPLKDFELTPEERYELRIAALLHDCGKVVTPVHVMDKATKLETIFDRIELVELRYEILRRDERIRALCGVLAGIGIDAERALTPELAGKLAALDQELSLLRRCNQGGEFMPESLSRTVRELGSTRRWTDARGVERELLSNEEVENLTISKGTLNPAEREIIRYHAVATIKLLEELPFPEQMRNVPAIAGSHHERMDGQGYPNRLRRDQISMQGRILGLADVFEALSAKDRPYKPGKSLSECLRILGAMCEEGHIDPHLYALFVEKRLYLRYAVDYLEPEQIDEAHHEELERLTWDLAPRA